jgi:hypothetical protein
MPPPAPPPPVVSAISDSLIRGFFRWIVRAASATVEQKGGMEMGRLDFFCVFVLGSKCKEDTGPDGEMVFGLSADWAFVRLVSCLCVGLEMSIR